MPGSPEFPLQGLKLVLPQRKILHRGIFIYRVPGIILHIINQMAAPLAGLPDFLLYGQVLVQIGRRGLYGVLKTPGQKLGLKLHLDKDIKQHPEYGNHQHGHDPGHLKAGIDGLVENIYDDHGAEQDGHHIYDMDIILQPPEHPEQDPQLYGHEQDDKRCPPKYDPE